MSTEVITHFAQLALSAPVLQAVNEIGYESPSPIQAQAIPPLLAGRDLLGQAQTGTGKTAAFALPILSRLDLGLAQPQVLVLTPTRELAIQVAEAMQTYARHLKGFHVLPIYGGQGMDTQLRALRRGVHAVVGTPGRVQDHLRRGTLKLDRLTTLVLDEADEMLRMGFIDEVEQILQHTPAEKQVALFSATMPAAIQKVAQKYLRDPVEIKIKNKTSTVAAISQRYWEVTGLHKLDALTRILEVEEFDAMIVFVRTKTATVELAERLEARGFSCSALNGDMNQVLRERTVERLKKGSLDIVVATDVAARGLDVERISHVVNYDIPYDTEAYVHRIGRTGRAGRKGEAILFVAPREKRMLRAIETATRQPITPMQLPSHADIADRRVTQFKQTISATLAAQELDFFEKLITDYQREHDVTVDKIAAALAYLVQKERPLLPAAEKSAAPAAARVDRAERQEKPRGRDEARRGHTAERSVEAGMVRYRMEVGRDHGVQPKNIVGAIANEAGMDSQNIGHIKLYDDYSTVDLPAGMPKDIFKHLTKVWVCGQQLRLSVLSGDGQQGEHKSAAAQAPRKEQPQHAKAHPKKTAKPKPKVKIKE